MWTIHQTNLMPNRPCSYLTLLLPDTVIYRYVGQDCVLFGINFLLSCACSTCYTHGDTTAWWFSKYRQEEYSISSNPRYHGDDKTSTSKRSRQVHKQYNSIFQINIIMIIFSVKWKMKKFFSFLRGKHDFMLLLAISIFRCHYQPSYFASFMIVFSMLCLRFLHLNPQLEVGLQNIESD